MHNRQAVMTAVMTKKVCSTRALARARNSTMQDQHKATVTMKRAICDVLTQAAFCGHHYYCL